MDVYIAGPMSGLPQFNYPAFIAAAEFLRNQGYTVYNPAEMDEPHLRDAALASPDGNHRDFTKHVQQHGNIPQTWGDFLSRDVKLIADEVDAICLLPQWNFSRGARLETFVALTTQKKIMHIDTSYTHIWYPDPQVLMRYIVIHTLDQGDVSHYEE